MPPRSRRTVRRGLSGRAAGTAVLANCLDESAEGGNVPSDDETTVPAVNGTRTGDTLAFSSGPRERADDLAIGLDGYLMVSVRRCADNDDDR